MVSDGAVAICSGYCVLSSCTCVKQSKALQMCSLLLTVAGVSVNTAFKLPAATCMNQQSSRSHCIVTVTVEKTCPDGTMLVGKLKMVDLAGRYACLELA